MERDPKDWERVFINNANDKGLVSKIYKQLSTGKSNQTTQPKKCAEDLNRILQRRIFFVFLQRRHTDSQQSHEKMLNI